VAVKVLAPDPDRDAAVRTRMIREVRAAAAAGHPHILPVYEADEADGTVYVAMHYARGGGLRSLLSRLGSLPPGYAWHIIAQIASALDAAHAQGLIHRDVKPANILFDAGDTAAGRPLPLADGQEPGHAYLSDFGMGQAFSHGHILAAEQIGGTLHYLAPEQIEGRALDGRADLYSLACTAFELLCGTPPFGPDLGLTLMYAQLYASSPAATARRADLPKAVDLVLATALTKDPAGRYPSCGQFAEELRAALGLRAGEPGDPPQSRSPGGAGPVAESGLAIGGQPAAWPGPQDPDAADEPNGPDPDPSARRPAVLRLILAAAAVVVGIGGVASGVALSQRSAQGRPAVSVPAASSPAAPSGSPSAASSPTASVMASEQAAAVSTLLTSSAASLTALRDAVGQVAACTNLSNAVSQLQTVVNQRASEYGRGAALPTSALPDGAAVKSELIAALSSSLKADRDYLTWARQQLDGGCAPADQSSAYSAAFSASQLAGTAKEAFVQVWNPVAAKYGIKQVPPGSI
jgi:serine/threonine protein kinase